MKIILFGAIGMVGKGVLRECLLDPEVTSVLSIGRTHVDTPHAKLQEIVEKDLFNLPAYASKFAGYDACFFCLGDSSVGMEDGILAHHSRLNLAGGAHVGGAEFWHGFRLSQGDCHRNGECH